MQVPGSDKISGRAKRLAFSKYVQEPQDLLVSERYYFVKAFIRASMDPTKYLVWVILSVHSGSILYAECVQCKQSALGRCGHVRALLQYMSDHVKEKGYGRKLIICWYYRYLSCPLRVA